ncbi:MAG TPA: uridine diphosphate-N-acetylglucosamine-binding protein YvcK [Deinococcales bacterium]|nr:uridine diphosphate-N-acetylglucosamine-binding protein YvcK [Deinococcales bacterium]
MRLWLMPGMGVKRYVLVAALGGVVLLVGTVLLILWFLAGERQVVSDPIEAVLVSTVWERWGIWLALAVVLAGIVTAVSAVGRMNRSLLSHWTDRPSDAAEVLFEELQLAKGPAIVALGGGSGLSMLLRGLRNHTSNLTAIVSVADDGGSSGRLRQEFDMPAPGDLSDCLAALSDRDQELGKLLQYRFVRGSELKGHTLGNLLITTLTEVQGDFGTAIDTLNSLLDLKGHVYPATTKPVSLVARKEGGVEVRGESALRSVPGGIQELRIEPEDVATLPQVRERIMAADTVVLGPGSLFSSTVPPLLVPGVRSALRDTAAKLVYVCNIMTEAGETDGLDALGHVAALEQHLGRWPDVVLVNDGPLDADRLEAYGLEGAEPVLFSAAQFSGTGVMTVALDLLADGRFAYHDAGKLADWLVGFAKRQQSDGRRQGRSRHSGRMEVH